MPACWDGAPQFLNTAPRNKACRCVALHLDEELHFGQPIDIQCRSNIDSAVACLAGSSHSAATHGSEQVSNKQLNLFIVRVEYPSQ